jgi:hypothetical protein
LNKLVPGTPLVIWIAGDYTIRSRISTELNNGVTLDEPLQLSLSLKLIADPKGRADRNLRLGLSHFQF